MCDYSSIVWARRSSSEQHLIAVGGGGQSWAPRLARCHVIYMSRTRDCDELPKQNSFSRRSSRLMLASSWALVRSPLFSLRRSAHAATRTFSSSSVGTVHPCKFHLAHYSTTETEDASAQTAKNLGQSTSENVLEDDSEEYMFIASASKPPTPSVMEVVNYTLPAMLPQPPTDGASILEDPSSEYETASLISVENTQSIDRQFWKLLDAKEYDQVYELLREVKQLGHRLWSHPAYEGAAIATLEKLPESRSPSDLSEQLTRFEAFFSRVPPAWATDRKRSFREIRKRVLNTPLINMDLVIGFSLILARKGYSNLVQKHTIPIICRFASSKVCLEFVDNVIVANKMYHSSSTSQGRKRMSTWNLRSTMLYWLAFSNRLDEAISLLPRDGLPMDDFRLTPPIHSLLHFRLEQSSKPEHHELITYVNGLLRAGPVFQDPINRVSRDIDGTKSLAEPAASGNLSAATSDHEARADTTAAFAELDDETIVDMEQPTTSSADTLATSLRHLKNAYSRSPGQLFTKPPPLSEVLAFFTLYTTHSPDSKGRAIGLLRRRAFRLGSGPASHFLFAEMLHYYRAGLLGLVMETYVQHFYISALPREEVLAHCHKFLRYRNEEYDAAEASSDASSVQLPFRIGIGVSKKDLLLSKMRLWPATGHTTLMWHALVSLTAEDGISQLYQKLLQIAAEGSSFISAQNLYSTALVPPSTWRAKVPAAAFTPFFRRMLRTASVESAASLGASLWDDMLNAGIAPNTIHLTEMARFYAHRGDSRRAFMIMEKMEAAKKEREQLADASINDPASSIKPALFPIPDIIFYCALLRAFIINRNLDDAERVVVRIAQLCKRAPGTEEISPGQHEVINNLRQDLAKLRQARWRKARVFSILAFAVSSRAF